jgi:hypothetical protein
MLGMGDTHVRCSLIPTVQLLGQNRAGRGVAIPTVVDGLLWHQLPSQVSLRHTLILGGISLRYIARYSALRAPKTERSNGCSKSVSPGGMKCPLMCSSSATALTAAHR